MRLRAAALQALQAAAHTAAMADHNLGGSCCWKWPTSGHQVLVHLVQQHPMIATPLLTDTNNCNGKLLPTWEHQVLVHLVQQHQAVVPNAQVCNELQLRRAEHLRF